MKRLLIKYLLRVFIAVIAVAVVISVAFNIYLSLSKKTVSNISKKYLNQEITVDRIFYVFPNVVILKNVVIREEISSPEDSFTAIISLALASALPPSKISVPRPAILVAMVIAPSLPA